MAFKGPSQLSRIRPTGVDVALLEHIGVTLPDPPLKTSNCIDKWRGSLQHVVKWPKRANALIGEPRKPWRMKVSCWNETIFRITGQDVQRGTFLHRQHAAVKDQNGTRVHSSESYKYCQAHGSIRPQGTNGHWKYASRFHCPQLHLVKSYQILGADFNEANILREAVDYCKLFKEACLVWWICRRRKGSKIDDAEDFKVAKRMQKRKRVLLASQRRGKRWRSNRTTVTRKRQRWCKQKYDGIVCSPLDNINYSFIIISNRLLDNNQTDFFSRKYLEDSNFL